MFYYWGPSHSKEGDDRLEAKVDALLRERGIDPEELNARVVESADS